LLGAAALAAFAAPGAARAGQVAWNFSFASIDDGVLPLNAYRGRVLLVVNTASFCHFTYQYESLEALYAARQAEGLTVVGVPSPDFMQESDSNAKVKQFCDLTFKVKFPLAGISHVRGEAAVPFYQWVRAERDWQPSWNFNKVLVGRDGAIKGVFGSWDEPDGPTLTKAINAALAEG
jgi:glutathione peroxidase